MSVHEQIAKLTSKADALEARIFDAFHLIGDLQKWQSTTVENWMRRVESFIDEFQKFRTAVQNEPLDFIDSIEEKVLQLEKRTTVLPQVFNNVTHTLEMIENLVKRVDKIELFISEQQVKSREAREVIKGLAEGLQEAKVSEHVRPEIVSEFLEKSISILEPEKPAPLDFPRPKEDFEFEDEDT